MAKLVFTPLVITPNSSLRIGNLDICVADNGARAVVVVTQAGNSDLDTLVHQLHAREKSIPLASLLTSSVKS